MKTIYVFGLALVFLLLLVALVNVDANHSLASAQNQAGAFPAMQITQTPPAEDDSEVGSTDGIMLMGVVITFIVVMPLLFHRKR